MLLKSSWSSVSCLSISDDVILAVVMSRRKQPLRLNNSVALERKYSGAVIMKKSKRSQDFQTQHGDGVRARVGSVVSIYAYMR